MILLLNSCVYTKNFILSYSIDVVFTVSYCLEFLPYEIYIDDSEMSRMSSIKFKVDLYY